MMFWMTRASFVGLMILTMSLVTSCGVGRPLGPPDDSDGAAGSPGSGSSGSARGSAGAAGHAAPPTTSSTGGASGAGAGTGAGGAGAAFACGPAGAGLVCSCGNQPYFPPPAGSAGQTILPPDPNADPGYRTLAELDELVVGRWVRTAGTAELPCEQYGLDFTSDHQLIPLVIASDGSVQPVPAARRSFTIDFSRSPTPALVVGGGQLTTNAPLFTTGPDSFYFLYSPWPALYARVR